MGLDHQAIMHGANMHESREIASLTKVMTCYTVLKLTLRNFNKHNTLVKVSRLASEEVGTTANLQEGHTFSVWDLLHGLMLPSGNDAAIALAEHFGDHLLKQDQAKHGSKVSETAYTPLTNSRIVKDALNSQFGAREKTRSSSIFPEIKMKNELNNGSTYITDYCSTAYNKKDDRSHSFCVERGSNGSTLSTKLFPKKLNGMFAKFQNISRFIQEMNINAKMLGMTNTKFDSPHGLANRQNKSTAYDIAMLCAECIKMPEFNRVTRTKTYTCKSRSKNVQLNAMKSVGPSY